jgi:excisionase family DNA binding protein
MITSQITPTLARLQYPVEESAVLLGVSRHTIRRDIRLGKIRINRYGTRVFIPAAELQRIAAGDAAAVAVDSTNKA